MFIFFNLELEEGISFGKAIRDSFLIILPLMYIAYSGFWAKAKFFNKRKYGYYFMTLVFISISSLAIFELLKNFDHFTGNSVFQNFTNIVFMLLLSTGLQYFKRGIVNQHQLQELRAKTAETELNALKAQINPHFLFNTLNNIYGINQTDAAKGSEMILELSDVMRYHLEFSKMGKIKITDEIQLINSYIRLEALRLTNNCDLKVDTQNIDESLLISPLLLLPFVENAFKHGTHPLKPCFININLSSNKNEMLFTINNSIITDRKVVKTNIGLENTKRRLELIYPNNHSLDIDSNKKSYSVKLKINI